VHTIAEWWMWLGFFIFVVSMISIDVFLLGGKTAHHVSTRESLSWVAVWITLALVFNLLLWWYLASTGDAALAKQKSVEFFTGYLIEESLSIDNMFVFLMIFNYFSVPLEYQRRVLLFGILGAIIMRLIMILIGVWLVEQFSWLLYLFGLFLLITGIKMLIFADKKLDLATNPVLIWMSKHLNVAKRFDKEKFFTIENGKKAVTPLFLVLILIEIGDLIFAVDSIPAVFAVTSDPFIIFTSNIFALLGLRSLYFLLANIANRFRFLKYGLAIILTFIGGKMLMMHWYKIPPLLALSIVAMILLTSVILSIFYKEKAT
jgi:tellurite resistance protein TerC